jgi:hypothetical protein
MPKYHVKINKGESEEIKQPPLIAGTADFTRNYVEIKIC